LANLLVELSNKTLFILTPSVLIIAKDAGGTFS
jgi:hypothetical protein